ncbi:hypothetical protein CDCA_CDCA05G1529 [Cyanidium caldarium]|uniref:DNA replication complex GINS protein PSF2 n=1 Tax=Cyanidium caldarium TaxID=2771 RepID=A0AAV9ITM1_CYACA|nr:hypothetical protein CDCA_CDCA05G1529 [Cyanidium caldarium]
MLTRGPTLSELEYSAEDVLIWIEPRVSVPVLHLIAGDFGPLLPPETALVPLWVALALRRSGYCRVRAPVWLTVEWLERQFEAERESRVLTAMPFRFEEVATLLLEGAADDVADAARVRACLENLLGMRQGKLRRGLQDIQHSDMIKLNGIGAMELATLRPVLKNVLEGLHALEEEEEEVGDEGVVNASADRHTGEATMAHANGTPGSARSSMATAPRRLLLRHPGAVP